MPVASRSNEFTANLSPAPRRNRCCDTRKGKRFVLASVVSCGKANAERLGPKICRGKGLLSVNGGSLPAMLGALGTEADIGNALSPWEGRLSNKERTLILREQRDWRRAVDIFEWFKNEGYEVNVIHYNVMLRIVGNAGRWDLVVKLWCEMQARSVMPTNATYGTLIAMYSNACKNKETLLWIGDMCKRGLTPDEVTMGTLLKVHKLAGKFDMAELVFKNWCSQLSDGLEDGRCYSLHTFNSVIDLFGKSGRLDKASEVFAQMLMKGLMPDIVSFNTMIHICSTHDRMEEVDSLMTLMEELRCFPNVRTFNTLMSFHLKKDDISAAEKCFFRMKAANLVPDVFSYGMLLRAYSVRSMLEKAEALVCEMEEARLAIDEYTHSALTRMYVGAGLADQAWCWFKKFADQMGSECFSANINAFVEQGLLSHAERVFTFCLERQKLSVLSCNAMIKGYVMEKEFDKACKLVDEMEKYDILPDKITYCSLIQVLSAADMPDKALCYLRKMQQDGFVSDCIPYSWVIGSLAKLGDIKTAEIVFNEMVASGIQADIVVYSIFINSYAEIGYVEKALHFVSLMYKAGIAMNVIVCNSLLKLYMKAGNVREASETYEHLKSFDGHPDLYASNCMISLYSGHCMLREAEEIFDILKKRGKANEFSYSMMTSLYKRVGQLDKGLGIAKEMLELAALTDTLSYNTLIVLYVSAGRMKEAVRVFRKMLNSNVSPNDATFRELGVILIKRGVPKGAVNHLEQVRKCNAKAGLLEWCRALEFVSRLQCNAKKRHNIRDLVIGDPPMVVSYKSGDG